MKRPYKAAIGAAVLALAIGAASDAKAQLAIGFGSSNYGWGGSNFGLSIGVGNAYPGYYGGYNYPGYYGGYNYGYSSYYGAPGVVVAPAPVVVAPGWGGYYGYRSYRPGFYPGYGYGRGFGPYGRPYYGGPWRGGHYRGW